MHKFPALALELDGTRFKMTILARTPKKVELEVIIGCISALELKFLLSGLKWDGIDV